jgi:hypothetical protein
LVVPNLEPWGLNTVGWVQGVSIRKHAHTPSFIFWEYRALDMPNCHLLPFIKTDQWNRNRDIFSQIFEVVGFFWWQKRVHLIKQLRNDFNAPDAKFVCATLGQTRKGSTDNGGMIFDTMFAVDGRSGNDLEFKGNVAPVYSPSFSIGGSSGGHHDGNTETCMNAVEAMGRAMIELLKAVID